MKWKVEKFNGQGRWLDQEVVEAETRRDAIELAFFGLPHFYNREPGEAYCHAAPYSPPKRWDEPCGRCGGPRSSCGGESNPHE